MCAKFQTPRGTRDFMPGEMARRNYAFSVVRKAFESYGFQPLETPAFESWELLSAKGAGGDAVKDEIYYFKDKGGRGMGLRFEFTASLARVVANNPQLAKPFKRYQIGPVWRYDKPQSGRFREFWQADIDIIGSPAMAAEAECIAVFCSCLESLGFRDFQVRLNSRLLLNGIIDAVGIDKKKSPAVFRALDKLEKQGKETVIKELKKAKITAKQIDSLMNTIKLSGKPDVMIKDARKLLEGYSEAQKGLDQVEEIVKLSKSYGNDKHIVIDMGLVRGLDYYTGPIYEITVKSKASVGSVAGGGRYDNLIEKYGGPSTPAVGISLGVERVCEIMKQEGMFRGIPGAGTEVMVVAAGDDAGLGSEAVSVSEKLRKEGISAETDLMGRKLKQLFDYAEKKSIPYMIIIGEKELKSGKLTFKDLKKREQKSMTLPNIIKALNDKK